MRKKKSILVVGSVNMDYVNYLTNFPMIGETILSDNYMIFFGGKGANQAVAASKMSEGNNVSLFAKIGSRLSDDEIIRNLKKYSVNTDYVSRSKLNTGSATILISKAEENNQIIINKGANTDFDKDDIQQLKTAIENIDYVLLQLETNRFLIEETLRLAKENDKMVFLNPSPAEDFQWEWLDKIDWLIPNETELEKISNTSINNLNDIKRSIDLLRKKGLKNIIVTLGENGVYYDTFEEKKFISTSKVTPVDTTGAGDTFIGTFVGNYEMISTERNIILSMRASKEAVLKNGVHDAIPTLKEIKNKIKGEKNE